MSTIVFIALAWVFGSVAVALILGRWLRVRPLEPSTTVDAPEKKPAKGVWEARGPWNDNPVVASSTEAQPLSGINTLSRRGSGRSRISSRSA